MNLSRFGRQRARCIISIMERLQPSQRSDEERQRTYSNPCSSKRLEAIGTWPVMLAVGSRDFLGEKGKAIGNGNWE